MNTGKKIAIMVGVFYIAGTVAGILSLVFTEPALNAPDYLMTISENSNQVVIGALLELLMGIAVAGIACTVYPVLRKYHPSIAIGYVGARFVEFVICIVGVISLLTLLTLSRGFVQAGTQDASSFHTLGELLLATRDWGGHGILDVAVFPLGALIFSYALYQSKLIPRWLSGWGFITAILYWIPGMLVMFALISPLSTHMIVLQAPLGLQEMVMAVWLIVKGFNASAPVFEVPKTNNPLT